ncbi:guanylate kinase [Candidatus Fukatsuia anoeciicola]|uniref:guanylate kinase n=1 Tax=Candidatus Fukatsuia anoeciicola TaxID=2994492 RepID=UPI003463C251
MLQGILYIISAPSGTGKSSLLQTLLKTVPSQDNNDNNPIKVPSLQLSVSYTTRTKRPAEKDGEDYFFISKKEFYKMINEGEFLEWANVFGYYYGTSRKIVENKLSLGIDVFLDIDWQGGKKVRSNKPATRSIFILPPSKKALNCRLQNRAQDSEEVIKKRMAQAITEMSHFVEYDYLIINDQFEQALLDLKMIIYAERLCLGRQKQQYNDLINQLLEN